MSSFGLTNGTGQGAGLPVGLTMLGKSLFFISPFGDRITHFTVELNNQD